MVRRTSSWPVGTPCWVDLFTPDPAGARAYYADLLGWSLTPGGPQSHGYAVAEIEGDRVAGVHGIASPARWTTYLAVDDADAISSAISRAGGTVEMGPIDVPGARMLLATDAVGAWFGVWEAAGAPGCTRVNEPGAFTWAELLTADPDRAEAFYAEVFGVGFSSIGGEAFRFEVMEVAGTVVGGVGGVDVNVPAWRLYFGATDVDGRVAEAVGRGAAVVEAPHDTPFGRWAQLTDPGGATYCVITPPDEAPA